MSTTALSDPRLEGHLQDFYIFDGPQIVTHRVCGWSEFIPFEKSVSAVSNLAIAHLRAGCEPLPCPRR